MADSGTQETDIVHDISPYVQKAITELDHILDSKKSSIEQGKLIKDELQRLHQEMSSRMAYIESLVDDLK